MRINTRTSWLLIIPLTLYMLGALFIPKSNSDKLKQTGLAYQEEYTWVDKEGEEHEEQSLLTVYGVGRVLTYVDVYSSLIVLFIPILVAGRLIYGECQDERRTLLLGASIIGFGLISISTTENVVSSVCYWVGIIAFSVITGQKSE